ncbi:hypothetical protein ACN28I_36595 [Archangium gephyra]|uniref:hypothetical protein n=1 Tax=Archangium gephyra TaxID=48 RepID=UPI003B774521
MEPFLVSIGWYNVAAGLALFALLSPRIGQKVLGEWCRLTAAPYSLGDHGALWLWWAALTNLFFGAVNVLAAGWEPAAQRAIAWLDLAVYVPFLVLALGALRSPRYGRGVWVAVPLFGGWIAWNLHALLG